MRFTSVCEGCEGGEGASVSTLSGQEAQTTTAGRSDAHHGREGAERVRDLPERVVVLAEAVQPAVVADADGLDLAGRPRVERRLRLWVGRVDDDFWVVRLDHVDWDLVEARQGEDLGGEGSGARAVSA